MYKPDYLVDLHCHTNRSDGHDTPQELIDFAAEIGMKVIAITDHDMTPPDTVEVDGEMRSIYEYAREKGVNLIGGYEFSCDTDVDDVHIVGLDCDWLHVKIIQEVNAAIQSKVEGYRELTKVLTRNGIRVSWEDILMGDGKPRRDEEVQRKHIFEAIAKKGYAPDWKAAKLLVRDNPEYNVRRQKIHPLQAIEVIHEAGGLAILAHPYLIDAEIVQPAGPVSRQKYIENLIQAGLDGIEAAYTYNKTSYQGRLSCEEIEAEVIATYGNVLRIISGGSDYHNDGKTGVKNPRMPGEKGITLEYFRGNSYLNRLYRTGNLK